MPENNESKKSAGKMRGAILDETKSGQLDRVLELRGRTFKAQLERWIDVELQMITIEEAERRCRGI